MHYTNGMAANICSPNKKKQKKKETGNNEVVIDMIEQSGVFGSSDLPVPRTMRARATGLRGSNENLRLPLAGYAAMR